MPRVALAAFGPQPPLGRVDRRHVAAVPVHQQHGGPVQAGVTAELQQQQGQRLGADRQRSREGRVLAAGPDGDRGGQPHAGPSRARPGRDCDRDPGVGVHRQVRPVLLA
jgi:hypothetical protein